MRATNHGLIGSIIAINVHQPILAAGFALASHFIFDAIPHSGRKTEDYKSRQFKVILGTDMVLAVVSTLLVASAWSEYWWQIIMCAFLAASPDLMWLYYRFIRPKQPLDPLARFHSWIQWSQTIPGYVFEGIFFIVVFSSLMYYGK